jgi:hypothetical protein
MAHSGMARPVLIGPAALIAAAADAAQVDVRDFELIDSGSSASDAALRACTLARSRDLRALMKGSLHTDELMAAVVNKEQGLRSGSRISHAFVFDLPRYHKLLALADCVVNIAPDLKTKKDILGNAVGLLHKLGIAQPKVGIVAAVGQQERDAFAELRRAGLQQEPPEPVLEGLERMRTTPFGGPLGGLRIADLARGQRLHEMNFDLTLAAVRAADLAAAFAVGTVDGDHDYPFTQTTCFNVCTISTRSLCAAITASMSL